MVLSRTFRGTFFFRNMSNLQRIIMKRGLIILAGLLLALIAGVAASFILMSYRSMPLQPASVSEIYRCPSAREVISSGKYVVISVPNDREFYIGKSIIALPDIPNRLRQLTDRFPSEERTVFVKGAPNIRYETLSAIINKVHDAGVDRIEVVPNPKND